MRAIEIGKTWIWVWLVRPQSSQAVAKVWGWRSPRHWRPTGPESLSGKDVAEIFTKVLGRLITFHPISYEAQKQAMIDVGLPEPVAKDNALAVAWMADGDCDYVTDDVPQILGRPAGSFERFAIDYAEAFS